MSDAPQAPLAGVRVLECGHFIAGPRSTQILADHGAEVIKLEPPGGDLSRQSAPKRLGWSMYFTAHNRHKKSMAVDLKTKDGRRILHRLIRWADVIVTSYRPSASERLGLDFANASQINPKIVIVRISAFGSDSLGRDLPGFDGTVQARSGLAHMIGEADGPPTITSVPLMDYFAAVEASLAVTLGLRRRDMTGQGQEVDVSMMDAAVTTLGYLFAEVQIGGEDPMRSGSRAPYALTGAYEAKDGFVYIAPMGAHAWGELARIIGHPEWGDADSPFSDSDVRLGQRDTVEAAVSAWTSSLTREEVVSMLREAGVPCATVNSVTEVGGDPLLKERSMLREVRLGSSKESVPMPGIELKVAGVPDEDHFPASVPELGAHTKEILESLGFSSAEIDGWITQGIVFADDRHTDH